MRAKSSLILSVWLIIILTNFLCSLGLGSTFKLKPTSKAKFELAIIDILPGVSSRIVCASICRSTVQCTSSKVQDESCILVDGRDLTVPKPNEEIELIQFDESFPPIHGMWSSWSLPFSDCSNTCGGGEIFLTRTCTNPSPEYNGEGCQGNNTQYPPFACDEEKCISSVLKFPGFFGVWGEAEICPASYGFVTSMKTRALAPQGGSVDDLGMTEINLFCQDGTLLRSAYEEIGNIGAIQTCPDGYNEAKVQMEPLNFDDTAANCLQLKCVSDGTWHKSYCTNWGTYTTKSCAANERICGLRTRLEKQVNNKGSGINDVNIVCCSGYP